MKQMNCPVCDTECWFIAASLYVIESTRSDVAAYRIIVTLKPHECSREKLEAMV